MTDTFSESRYSRDSIGAAKLSPKDAFVLGAIPSTPTGHSKLTMLNWRSRKRGATRLAWLDQDSPAIGDRPEAGKKSPAIPKRLSGRRRWSFQTSMIEALSGCQ